MKPVLVSGIQPSGRLHLGNYLGALKNFADLQNSGKYRTFYFLADLHSLTEYPANAKEEQKRILELTADFLAAGLDPKKSVIYQQSQIPAHAELAWILNTITPLGELYRMTQFKDKSQARKQNANVGLLAYPTLMAADIILYDAIYVPVGEDQVQHLELTRTLARKFNRRFGDTFVEPKALLTATSRVMSLGDPRKKMSKSQPETCLFLDDSPSAVRAKMRKAVTDSGSEVRYDPKSKAAISNLLGIYAALSGKPIPALEARFKNKRYAEFKNALADLIVKHFARFRKRKAALLKKPDALKEVLRRGSARAAKTAENKIKEVKKRVGLVL